MAGRSKQATVPATPRVTSPSPVPDADAISRDSTYNGPMTRSAARRRQAAALAPSQSFEPSLEDLDSTSDEAPDSRRMTRSRSRSPVKPRKTTTSRKATTATNGHAAAAPTPTLSAPANGSASKATENETTKTNGHLFPPTPTTTTLSRSPSPLGVIPIHTRWRNFVHKHEVPRKALHVSIGFFVVWLYLTGTQTYSVCPYLMTALIPIAAVDVVRHHYAPFNRFYVRVLGLLMRESEFAGYNGVIFYLLGAWAVLYFFPKDVGVMGTLLLSWCDTAASTFGRLYGRYTPSIRRGKSLAGSLAAFLVGVGTSAFFWGWLAPTKGPQPGDETFMFTGALSLPRAVAGLIGLPPEQATVSGAMALGIMSVWSGFVAAASEVVDLFGWDDNLTIPVLSGLGIWGFLKIFG